jgi:hypothetical protein
MSLTSTFESHNIICHRYLACESYTFTLAFGNLDRFVAAGSRMASARQILEYSVIASELVGAVAQLGERRVRNAKVGSSILLRSTKNSL